MDDPTAAPAESWLIAQTKPNGGRIAEANLARQGFVSWRPVIEETRRRGARFVTRSAPLFPGYVFVLKDPGLRWQAIASTRGIARLLTLGGRPAELPGALIAGLAARFDRAAPPPALTPGDAVRVAAGPFAELAGRIEALAPEGRIQVLIEAAAGGATSVALKPGDLRRIGG